MAKQAKILDPHMSSPHDGKILDYYSGVFDTVFIALPPFFHPNDPSIFELDEYPNKQQILETCNPLPWSEIISISNFKSLSEIDVALRSYIHSLKAVSHNAHLVDRLEKILTENNLHPPDEGYLAPHLEDVLFRSLLHLGYDSLWVTDEFALEGSKEFSIEELIAGDLIPTSGNINSKDWGLLITTHWDSHCTYLCSSKSRVDSIVRSANLEGFYCTQNTEVFWGLYPI